MNGGDGLRDIVRGDGIIAYSSCISASSSLKLATASKKDSEGPERSLESFTSGSVLSVMSVKINMYELLQAISERK